MIEKAIQDNKAELLSKWLSGVDLNQADIALIEKQLQTALRGVKVSDTWYAQPIAPLAEPVNLDELLGDAVNGSKAELASQITRLDRFYDWLNDSNNLIQSELDTVEAQVLKTTDDVQDIMVVIDDENRQYVWVSDSFNNSSFVDPSSSTALIDTDSGVVSLGASSLDLVTNYDVNVNHDLTKGLPGCNLLVLNLPSTKGTEPNPQLDTSPSRNLSNLLDADSSTWFEVERNFIPSQQKLVRQGRAFTYSNSGTMEKVLSVTNNLDWNVTISWPDGVIDAGKDGKGVGLAEFIDLDGRTARLTDNKEYDAVLSFDLIFTEPTKLTNLQLVPYLRGNEIIKVESIRAELVDQSFIDIATNIQLGTDKSTTNLQREILRKTGTSVSGSYFTVPTDKLVTRLRVTLRSAPVAVSKGLAHPFQEKYVKYRTERNYGIFSSVDKWKKWSRVAKNTTPPALISTAQTPKLAGTLLDLGSLTYALGTTYNSLKKNASGTVANGLQGMGAIAGLLSKSGGTLGKVAGAIGAAAPYVGAALAVLDVVGKGFDVNHSEKILETRSGYDIFTGWRANVALRSLTLSQISYQSTSVLQSVKRIFPTPVTKVGLFVDELIPEDWGSGAWIKYYMSVDGQNWTEVSKSAGANLDGAFVPAQPTSEVFFKAVLFGNTNDTERSPFLRHYSLQGLPA